MIVIHIMPMLVIAICKNFRKQFFKSVLKLDTYVQDQRMGALRYHNNNCYTQSFKISNRQINT